VTANSDRALRWLLVGVAIVTVTTLVVGFITAPYIISGANNSDQVVKGNELNACRSQLAAQVTDARTNVDEARTGYEVALGEVAQQLAAKSDLTIALKALADAGDDIAAKTVALRQVTTDYKAALVVSSDDPNQFLTTYCGG
jgi:gamma-glutamyl:cysteine ligase YbdK (ATP-grasp superfamily)